MARPRKSSPLRERLTQTTRDVILDAVVVQLGEAGPFDFSYFEVARRSGVAVRTIYRHFPTRDDLHFRVHLVESQSPSPTLE